MSHRPKNVRNAIKQDIVQFAIPGVLVLFTELVFLAKEGVSGFWGDLWGVISRPSSMAELPLLMVAGMFLFVIGLTILIWGQVTLYKNYSGTVVIREGHELITHGIYSSVRNPMYLGGIIGLVLGLPAYAQSLNGFLISLLLIPILLNRIRLEEGLLTAEFGDEYLAYKASTKRLIPFVW
jgi:protein-S-isoprenylcysteine O-methyltransferase Ste14